MAIEDSFGDAIDADFSRLSFSKLNILRAGNDCLDVSSGEYSVKSANLENCKDKGISVGEMSEFSGDDIKVNLTGIGVSSKDLSKTSINTFKATETSLCAEAKQKKQEFGGATLTLTSADCAASFEVDAVSKIIVDN